jgi:hypothetical protein
MVEVVKISKKNKLLRIKEVSDIYREQPYKWDDENKKEKENNHAS